MIRWSSRVWLVLALAWVCACSGGGSGATGGVDAAPPAHDGGVLDRSLDGSLDVTVAAPAAPTFGGVTSATAIDESHVALAWAPATDATTPQALLCYRVYAGTTAGGEDFTTPVLTTPAGATGALLRGLSGDTTYYFVVRAVDADGNEDKNTVEQSAMTADTGTPTFAGVQSVTATGVGSLLVTWNPATDTGCPSSLITYRIFYSTTSGAENYAAPSAVTMAGATSVTMTNLSQGQIYYVVVRAVDAAGNSDANTYERSARTLDQTPPVFAGLASATAAGTAVLLTWPAATDAIDPSNLVYDVYVATTAGGEDFTSPSYVVAGGASFTVENLAVGTTYDFVVRARDTSGNEDTNTIEKSATTGAVVVTTPPTFAGAVSATGATDSTIVLTWNAATSAATPQADIAYDIYEAAASGAEEYGSGPTFTTPLGATTFTVTGLQTLQTWYFVVRARDLDGNEDTNTHEVSAKTLSDITPPSFGGLTSAQAVDPVEVALAWQPASDSATPQSSMSYEVFVGTTKGGEGTTPIGPATAPIAFTPAAPAPGTTTATVAGLTPGTQYWFYVRAVDAAGVMDTTPTPVELSVTTPADIPSFAGASTSSSTSPTSITVGWVAATDPDPTETPSVEYLVYVSTTAGDELSATPIVSPAGTTSATITGLTPSQTGTKYYVVVRAENSIDAIDGNDVEITQATEADTTAPAFAGATSTSGATPSSLTVNWSVASDPVTPSTAIKYLVCMTQTPGGCSGSSFTATAATTVTGGLSFTATGLAQNTTYYFVVRAENEVGLIDADNVQVSGVTVQTVFPPPSFTTNPTVTTPTTNAKYTTLPMSWLATAMPSGTTITYAVCYSPSSTACGTGGGTAVALPSPYTATSVTITGLPPANTATSYYVSVTATSVGGSTTAQSKVATVADTTGPSTPTGLTATYNASYPSSINLSWSAATGDPVYSAPDIEYVLCANGCAIRYVFNSAFTSSATSSFLGAQGSTTQGVSLTPNTAYTFTIQAIDPLGNASAVSTAVPGTTAVSFATDVLANIFNGGPNECNGCHAGGDVGPMPGPYTYAFITQDLTPTPVVYSGYTECAAGEHFVVAGNLGSSVLYQKMAGPNACSPGDLQMPYGGPFDAGLADVVGAWILQGAVNN
jgi:hypothetical protein